MTRRARRAVLLYGIAAAVYLLDRITKTLVQHHLAGRPPIRIIPGVLQLAYTTNSGGAFSVLGSQPWLFFGASLIISVAILWASPRVWSTAAAVGLGLVLGGAVGNLTDRLVNGPGVSGRVVDFIDFRVWPVFNVADSAIVVGAVILVVAGFGLERRAREAKEEAPRSTAGPAPSDPRPGSPA